MAAIAQAVFHENCKLTRLSLISRLLDDSSSPAAVAATWIPLLKYNVMGAKRLQYLSLYLPSIGATNANERARTQLQNAIDVLIHFNHSPWIEKILVLLSVRFVPRVSCNVKSGFRNIPVELIRRMAVVLAKPCPILFRASYIS